MGWQPRQIVFQRLGTTTTTMGALLVGTFALFACHTWIFQPVKKNIQGKWERLPRDPTIPREIWEITPTEIIIYVEDTTTRRFREVHRANYVVKFKLNKHILTANLPPWNNRILDWYIVKATKKYFYLAVFRNPELNLYPGNFQYDFVRYRGDIPLE